MISLTEATLALDRAIAIGAKSLCNKSKRGVVFVKRGFLNNPLAAAFNHPPKGFTCNAECLATGTCGQHVIHAEMAAMDMIREPWNLYGSEMIHAKVVFDEEFNPVLVPSKGPSCVECSKMMLHRGVAGAWLYLSSGLKRWDMIDFHRESLKANGLPICQP